MSEFEFAKLPEQHDLSAGEAAVLKDALVADADGLKVKIPDAPDLDDPIPGTSLPRFPRNRDTPPLEEYVADALEAVRRLVAAGLKNEVHRGEDRFARAERYARWRWQGYKDGEIKEL